MRAVVSDPLRSSTLSGWAYGSKVRRLSTAVLFRGLKPSASTWRCFAPLLVFLGVVAGLVLGTTPLKPKNA
jgi:uncharacterized membrane protein